VGEQESGEDACLEGVEVPGGDGPRRDEVSATAVAVVRDDRAPRRPGAEDHRAPALDGLRDSLGEAGARVAHAGAGEHDRLGADPYREDHQVRRGAGTSGDDLHPGGVEPGRRQRQRLVGTPRGRRPDDGPAGAEQLDVRHVTPPSVGRSAVHRAEHANERMRQSTARVEAAVAVGCPRSDVQHLHACYAVLQAMSSLPPRSGRHWSAIWADRRTTERAAARPLRAAGGVAPTAAVSTSSPGRDLCAGQLLGSDSGDVTHSRNVRPGSSTGRARDARGM
jgi:hypothetical protein